MSDLQELLDKNKAWAKRMRWKDRKFFKRQAEGQSPQILWLGCSDSRVPPTEIMKLQPGDLFVHRNIANVIVHSDLSAMSVMQYAVEHLKVSHIIVCGHYGCGGVNAAMGEDKLGLIDGWLQHIKEVRDAHAEELASLDEGDRFARMCELNVAAQVKSVASSEIVQGAWASGQNLTVHGWIYALDSGILKDLNLTISSK